MGRPRMNTDSPGENMTACTFGIGETAYNGIFGIGERRPSAKSEVVGVVSLISTDAKSTEYSRITI